MRRRGTLAGAVALVVIALTGCAGLPTSGPVSEGLPPGQVPDPADFALLAERPQLGATAQQIVEGFIAAGTDPSGDWEIARLFLAPALKDVWAPGAGVRIDDQALRVYDAEDEDSLTLTVTSSASVDEAGAYQDSNVGTSVLDFELARQSDGEWRITQAPDGIVLGVDVFGSVFRAYSVDYFDPSWQYLVPDLRWFPSRYGTAARITRSLTDGQPSAWLASSVKSAFTPDLGLDPQVTVQSGTATIEFTDGVGEVDQTTLSRMRTQLEASLSTAGIVTVELTVGGEEMPGTAAPVRDTRVSSRPAVQTPDGFGFLTGDELEPIPGLSAALADIDARAAQLAPDLDFAAALTADGVVRVAGGSAPVTVDTRAGLLAPTVDGFGYIWSVPTEAPDAVRATSPTTDATISVVWPGASRILAFQLSREGARAIAVVEEGGRTIAYAVGVIRDQSFMPVELGEPFRLGVLDAGTARAAVWLDQVTAGFVVDGVDSSRFVTQPIGGAPSTIDAPDSIVQAAGANQTSTVRLRAENGTFYERRGAGWSQTADDILLLATQQGGPQ